ncbi:MAG: TolC family protein [Vicinamibacterales bacterium]
MPHKSLTHGLLLLSLTVAAAACASVGGPDATGAASAIQERTGAAARVAGSATSGIPPGVSLADGLTADEAVALALWNNAAFQVSVSELGFARADLLDAGLLTNPVLSLLLPLGPKQFEATLRWPVEVLWERPRRIASARRAADVTAQRLVQSGLDLVLAVRTAYADLRLATERQRLTGDRAAVLGRTETLMAARVVAGDIAAIDARPTQVDAASARLEIERVAQDVTVARTRLRLLAGLTEDGPAFDLAAAREADAACAPQAARLREALIARPDVRAAELAVEAAAARLGWEKSRILTLSAVLDANGAGRDGFEAGPGIDASLPIFGRNQGGRARATAELQRAAAAYVAIQQQVAAELREALALSEQARQSVAAWRARVLPPLETNLADAERQLSGGETSQLPVLEHRRRLIDAQIRAREFAADVERARARVDRAIGRSCPAESEETPRDR